MKGQVCRLMPRGAPRLPRQPQLSFPSRAPGPLAREHCPQRFPGLRRARAGAGALYVFVGGRRRSALTGTLGLPAWQCVVSLLEPALLSHAVSGVVKFGMIWSYVLFHISVCLLDRLRKDCLPPKVTS